MDRASLRTRGPRPRRVRQVLAVLAVGLAGLAGGCTATGAETLAVASPEARTAGSDPPPATVPGELLVRFRSGADAGDRADARTAAGAELERRLPVRGLELVSLDPGVSSRAADARLERDPDVLYAEPNAYRRATVTPSDRHFTSLWGLDNRGQTVGGIAGTPDADVDAPEAWDLTTGAAGVAVAVVDTGVDYGHPDLAPNLWTNPGETGSGRESNGRDDDGNGLVDDWRGWDWVGDDNAPADENGHGTHVAGTVGARGNDGQGVTGLSWTAGIMPLRVLDAGGSGTTADLVSAYRYASANGAKVVNASLGGSTFSRAERDAIAASPNTLFVAAAGNGGADGVGDDNDLIAEYPCSLTEPNVVCVAASDQHDALAGFSNYGVTAVDLAAPGTSILSDQPGGGFAYYDGTSMATPHVAGAAALVWARTPGATPVAAKAALLAGVDLKPGLAGKTATGGRLNAFRALGGTGAAATNAEAPPAETSSPPPGAGSDTSPPVLSVAVRSRQRLRTVLSRGLRPGVGCSEACTARSQVTVDRRTARRLRLGSGARAVVLGRATATLPASGGTTVVVRLSRRARSALRRARSVTVRLRVDAADAASNASVPASRRVSLRR